MCKAVGFGTAAAMLTSIPASIRRPFSVLSDDAVQVDGFISGDKEERVREGGNLFERKAFVYNAWKRR